MHWYIEVDFCAEYDVGGHVNRLLSVGQYEFAGHGVQTLSFDMLQGYCK